MSKNIYLIKNSSNWNEYVWYLFMQLNVLNYYYNLQVYKYFDFIRTILEYTNDALINKYNNVQKYTSKIKSAKDYNIKKQYIICK